MRVEPCERSRLIARAQALQFRGEFNEPRAIFERLLEDNPDDKRVVIALAQLHSMYGLHGEALRLYQRAYDLFGARNGAVLAVLAWARGSPPYHPQSLAWVAGKYLERGRWVEGTVTYQSLVARLEELGFEHGAQCVRRILHQLSPPESGLM